WEDLARWALIARQLGLESTEARETYSTSPHLFSDLNIPEGAKGTLPKDKRTRAGLDAEEIEDLGGPDSRKRRGTNGRGKGRGEGRGRGRGNGHRRGGSSRGGESVDSGTKAEGDKAPRKRRRRSRTRRVNGKVVERRND
ncbi:MAG: ATP-dependent helicase, partial [Dermabacter sp.]|nr:ATP-dependent helicase [Dermabacter sp.]